MKKYTNYITAAVIIVGVLAVTYIIGDSVFYPKGKNDMQNDVIADKKNAFYPKSKNDFQMAVITDKKNDDAINEPINATETDIPKNELNTKEPSAVPTENPKAEYIINTEPTANAEKSVENIYTDNPVTEPIINELPKEVNENPDKEYSGINDIENADKYKAEPVPDSMPSADKPPETTAESDKQMTCSLSVRCDSILKNISKLLPEKKELVPADGVILNIKDAVFYDGESAFNVLYREARKNKIHIEFENTPVYNSVYIEGIGNLYEFDCGDLSGWMYRVNGCFPNYGCSRYTLKQGDTIEFVYTCDLGKDVGSDTNMNEQRK